MTLQLVRLVVVAAVLVLTPLAHATPVDQTWTGGLYDDADYDDVVALITSGVGTVEGGLPWSLGRVSRVVGRVAPLAFQRIRLVPPSSRLGRAPPIA